MVRLLSEEEMKSAKAALQPYFLPLGKVAHSWKHLHEELGKVFCAVTGLELSIGMSVWHALKSDRSQRDILEQAVHSSSQNEEWTEQNPEALEGMKWLLNKIRDLANKRNDAIHAPCITVDGEKDFEIAPVTFFGNRLARNLRGKDILKEFEWYEKTAIALMQYAYLARFALDSHGTWPQKPQLPSLGQDHSSDP